MTYSSEVVFMLMGEWNSKVSFDVPRNIKERVKKLLKKDKTGNLKNIVIPKYISYLKYMIYIEAIDKDTAIDLLDTFISSMRMLKLNEKTEEKGIGFIINLVFNYIQKINDDKLIDYVNNDKYEQMYKDLIDTLESSWNERSFGKPVKYWFMVFMPIIAGYIEPAYIMYSIWLFKPEVYYRLDGEKFYKTLKYLRDNFYNDYGIQSEWIILPRDFLKAEKLR